MKAAVSPRDLELLSAYLDQQLKPTEYARLQARLKTEAELAAALNDLRTTRRMLRSLPIQRAPHNFTLTPAMAGVKPAQPTFLPALRLASVLAAVLLVFVLAGDHLGFLARSGVQSLAMPAPGEEVAMQYADAMEAEAAEAPLALGAPPESQTPESKTVETREAGEEPVALALPSEPTPAPTDTARAVENTTPPTEETFSITGEEPLPQPTATLPPIPTFTPTASLPPTETPPPPPSAVPIPSRTPVETSAHWEETQPLIETPNPAQQTLTIIETTLAVVAILTGLAAIFLRRGPGK